MKILTIALLMPALFTSLGFCADQPTLAQSKNSSKNTSMQQTKQSTMSPPMSLAKQLFLTEGMVATYSVLASQSPELFGTAATLTAPLYTDEELTTAANFTSVSGFALLGLFNVLELTDDKYSSKEVFIANFAGVHAIFLGIGIAQFLSGGSMDNLIINDTTETNSNLLSIVLTPNGPIIRAQLIF